LAKVEFFKISRKGKKEGIYPLNVTGPNFMAGIFVVLVLKRLF
jgi:hypothetical protein